MRRLPNTPLDRIRRIEHGKRRRTRGVVIHVIDGTASSARWWFKDPRNNDRVGAHLIIGLKSAIQVADLDAVCFHARGANSDWIGFEHEGLGGQSAARWSARRTQRKVSANRAAWVCYHYGLGTPTWGKNIRPHASFPAGGHPGCPGKHFPKRLYIMAARRAYKNLVKSKGRTWAP